MFKDKIQIGRHNSSVTVVDATLRDFANLDGVFARCYGEEDARPVLDLCQRMIEEEIHALRKRHAHLTLCRSQYRQNQFNVQGLEDLCTTEAGRHSLLSPDLFDFEINKTDNSILSAGEKAEQLIDERNDHILTGVTTTSCIGKSINDIRARFAGRGKCIIVPRDAVAARFSQAKKADALFREWESDEQGDLIVIPSLRDIEFV